MAGSLYHGQQGMDTRVVVKLLLDHGTEVNADRGKVVFDAMQAAAYGGDEAIVQLLLDEDAGHLEGWFVRHSTWGSGFCRS